jgi:hypothetical protein
MSTVPPQQPPGGTPPQYPPPAAPGPGPGYGVMPGTMGYARMPIPGNAEFLLYVVVVVVLAIICAASDGFSIGGFTTAWTALTFGYFISRGIAKASRVLEQ